MCRGLGTINYVLEAEKQISDASVYRGVSSSEKIIAKLLEASNKMFSSLRRKGFITEKQIKYFTCKYKNATNFGKLYLLPKIHKLLVDVSGRLVIPNCDTPTEKCSGFLDHHLTKLIQKGWYYIKDSRDFIKRINNLDSMPENSILVRADVVGLCLSIPHEVGLRVLREALDKKDEKTIPTEELFKIAEFEKMNLVIK